MEFGELCYPCLYMLNQTWAEDELLTRPDPSAWATAQRTLSAIGARNSEGITPLGFQLLRLPLSIRHAAVAYASRELNCWNDVCLALAALSTSAPFLERQPGKSVLQHRRVVAGGHGDMWLMRTILSQGVHQGWAGPGLKENLQAVGCSFAGYKQAEWLTQRLWKALPMQESSLEKHFCKAFVQGFNVARATAIFSARWIATSDAPDMRAWDDWAQIASSSVVNPQGQYYVYCEARYHGRAFRGSFVGCLEVIPVSLYDASFLKDASNVVTEVASGCRHSKADSPTDCNVDRVPSLTVAQPQVALVAAAELDPLISVPACITNGKHHFRKRKELPEYSLFMAAQKGCLRCVRQKLEVDKINPLVVSQTHLYTVKDYAQWSANGKSATDVDEVLRYLDKHWPSIPCKS
jgi:hypothetical protein